MVKQRKRYDALTAKREAVRHAARNMMLRKVHGYDKVAEPLDLRTGRPFTLYLPLAKELMTMPCKWLVILFVWGRESNGKNRLDTEVFRTRPMPQHDLNDYLTEQLEAMHSRAKYTITTDGYICMPVPPEYVDEITDNLLYLRIKEMIDRPEYYEPLDDGKKTQFA